MAIDDLGDSQLTVIYGDDSCEDTTRARQHFDLAPRAYRYVRLEQEAEIRQRLHDMGHAATPVLVTPNGAVFVEPTDDQLAAIILATG